MSRRTLGLGLLGALLLSLLSAVPASAAKKLPDLVVQSVAVTPLRVQPGEFLRVKDTTRNRGRSAAKKSVTRYLLSKNRKWEKKDIVLGDRIVKRLKPGQRQATAFKKFRVPRSTKPGTYHLLACADGRKKIRESNERNNCRGAKGTFRVAAKAPTGPVEMNVKATIKLRRTYRTESADAFHTRNMNAPMTATATGRGWIVHENGKPAYFAWTWSSAQASIDATYHRTWGTVDCPYESTGSLNRTATVPTDFTGGLFYFDDVPGMRRQDHAQLGLSHHFHIPVTVTTCDGPGNENPFQVEFGDWSWSAEVPTLRRNWSKDLRTITWHKSGSMDYESPGGGTESSGFSSDVTLKLTPVKK